MEKCQHCNGEGLVSSGSTPLNLHEGHPITCPKCGGTGKIGSDEPEAIFPKAGDPCITLEGKDGCLVDENGKLVCKAN